MYSLSTPLRLGWRSLHAAPLASILAGMRFPVYNQKDLPISSRDFHAAIVEPITKAEHVTLPWAERCQYGPPDHSTQQILWPLLVGHSQYRTFDEITEAVGILLLTIESFQLIYGSWADLAMKTKSFIRSDPIIPCFQRIPLRWLTAELID